MDLKTLVQKLDKELGISVQLRPFGRTKELMFEVAPKNLHAVSQWLRSQESARLDWLDNFSAAEVKSQIVLTLFLRSQALAHTLILKTEIPMKGMNPVSMETVGDIWPMAQAHEEEISTLFGVDFKGNNAEEHCLALGFPEGSYPLRKDYSWEFDPA